MANFPLPHRLVGISSKMYWDFPTTTSYVSALAKAYPSPTPCGLFIIPSFPTLSDARSLLKFTPHILLGAQDCHWDNYGAYTGSVSPLMLKQSGCEIVELGHAERRRDPFNETDEMVASKAQAVTRNDMIPLVCIGEKRQSKSGIMSEGVGIAVREVLPQVEAVLQAIPLGSCMEAVPVLGLGRA